MKTRRVPDIALYKTNDNGGHNFIYLYKGKRIHVYNWNDLPIHDEVIERFKELAEDYHQTLLTDGYQFF